MQLRPIRWPPGTDLRGAAEALAATLPTGSGFVVSGIGSLDHAQLRFADAPSGTLLPGPLEIVSVSGSITPDGAHLHMAVSDADGRVWGGHVCAGCRVRTTAELLVAALPDHRLTRALDPATGFLELVVRPAPDRSAG